MAGYLLSVDGFLPPVFEIIFATPGTFVWTVPPGVTSVCAVCVGGGGGSNGGYITGNRFNNMGGGAGGALAWKNNIPVVPGQDYTVVVGAGGKAGGILSDTSAAGDGGMSYFVSQATVCAGGGEGHPTPGVTGATGTAFGGALIAGDGGGAGGNSGYTASTAYPAGAGGAGGYSGAGGNGGNGASAKGTAVNGKNGVGGAGGGGGGCAVLGTIFAAGGGVGIYGEGASGLGGITSGTANQVPYGGGGSGGGSRTTTSNLSGPLYGGGAGGANFGNSGGLAGANGVVRIIWGPGQSFPNNAASQ